LHIKINNGIKTARLSREGLGNDYGLKMGVYAIVISAILERMTG
jgi:hypothetical protein